MKKKTNNIQLFLTIGVVLLLVISFFYLTNHNIYYKQPVAGQITQISSTTFELLDNELCPNQCTDALHCENLFLFSVSSSNDKTVYQFLKDFQLLNSCSTKILFQTGRLVGKTWKVMVTTKPNKANFPKSSFALGYVDRSGFSIVDLARGKANGKFRKYNSAGSLFIEQELVNNSSEGRRTVYLPEYRIEQVWKENALMSEDTIK